MTIDEAIRHCEEVMMENLEKTKDRNASDPIAISCGECTSEHRQLAEWLKELKDYRECIPSYQAGYNDAKREIALSGEYERAYERGKADAQPRTGRWIPLEYDGYADGNPVWDKWECSKCGWEYSGDEESLTAFCPNCGQPKMEVKE